VQGRRPRARSVEVLGPALPACTASSFPFLHRTTPPHPAHRLLAPPIGAPKRRCGTARCLGAVTVRLGAVGGALGAVATVR
jgi:hypothetical protein